MSIQRVGVPQTGTAINGGDVTLTFDTSVPIQENDVILVYGGHYYREGAPLGPSESLGYIDIFENNEAQPAFGAWYKIVTSSIDTTVVCKGSGNAEDGTAYGAYVLRGVDVDDPIDVAAVLNGPKTFVNPAATAVTTATPMALVVAVGCGLHYDTTPGVLSQQYFGYTGTSAYVDDTRSFTIAAGMSANSTASSYRPGTWTAWNNQGLTGLVATFAFKRKEYTGEKRYWVGGTGSWLDDTNHWATSSGGTPGFGNLPDDLTDVVFDANSFDAEDQTVTANTNQNTVGVYSIYMTHSPNCSRDLSFADVTNSPTFAVPVVSGNYLQVRGSLVLSPNMALTGTGRISMEGDGEVTLNTCGLDLDATIFTGDPVWLHGSYTTCTLASELNCHYLYTGTYGHFKAMDYDINVDQMRCGGKTNLGSSTVTIKDWFDIWSSSTDFNAASSTVVVDKEGTTVEESSITIDLETQKLHNFTIIGEGGRAISFETGGTFDDFKVEVPSNLIFWEDCLYYFTNFTAYGDAAERIKIASSGPLQNIFIRI